IVGAVDPDGEQAHAKVEQSRASLIDRAEPTVKADRAFDLRWVAADVGAVLGQDRRLALERFEVGESVPDVCVPGDQLERLLLTAPADQDRDVPGRRRI